MPGTFSQHPAREVLRQFRLIFGTTKEHFRLVETRCGLGGAQLWALSEIAHAPGMSLGDLARALLVHQSTASNLVERIGKLGLIDKRRSKRDARSVCLYSTAKGRQLLARAPQPAIGVLPHALLQLSGTELEALQQSLSALVIAMKIQDLDTANQPLGQVMQTLPRKVRAQRTRQRKPAAKTD
jgi:DNA-binding MarR family transcriptional regulator